MRVQYSDETVAAAAAGKYRWAQDMAGVDVVASLPANYTGGVADREQVLSSLGAYRSQLRLEAFVERLASGKQSRLALK
jgi:hypothetical protein